MNRELEPSINEKNFLYEALRQGKRIDGRGIYDVRNIKITFGNQYGHVQVQLGKTRVFANVSWEVVKPYPDQPTEGFLRFNTEMSPMASPEFEPEKLSELEVIVSRLLEKSLRRSRAIDTEGLCIIAGEKVWSIRVDIRVLDHEGNITDCACIAAIAALYHFRRPEYVIEDDEVTILPLDQCNPVPLSIHHTPICISFAFFDEGDLMVVDPNLLEEQVKEGDMTITLNSHKELCIIHKAGGIPLEIDQILRCTKIASVKVSEITELINNALKEDEEKRELATGIVSKKIKAEVEATSLHPR
ncbi:hypothetical protein BCR36DRAFT_404935 [Piromyces finnis]|uniref:Exosome complex component RRP45 n=1 Tax=Piromyces finnis TaxID=1754191 RepID=A0A1Y1V9C6_9FUNG|nr:hypothetical protein BCR36DRAFT_404935 [Piromyces finnis]|eukprot:ORX49032.1 hypothetical protein BCR36DRAFT_404935 [Piromyces finnis]